MREIRVYCRARGHHGLSKTCNISAVLHTGYFVVLIVTRIIKSVIRGHTTVTMACKYTPGKYKTNQKWYKYIVVSCIDSQNLCTFEVGAKARKLPMSHERFVALLFDNSYQAYHTSAVCADKKKCKLSYHTMSPTLPPSPSFTMASAKHGTKAEHEVKRLVCF